MEKVSDQSQHKTAGDIAVSGLLGGLVGGLVMALVIVMFSLVGGHGISYLGFFSNTTPGLPVQGSLMHLAVSCIYGMFYNLLRSWIKVDRLKQLPGWLTGLVYALILWGFAVLVLLPASHSMILTLPWWVFFSGHVAYGLVLGEMQRV
jgi:hypothetical protein